jgi:hypothetical protein
MQNKLTIERTTTPVTPRLTQDTGPLPLVASSFLARYPKPSSGLAIFLLGSPLLQNRTNPELEPDPTLDPDTGDSRLQSPEIWERFRLKKMLILNSGLIIPGKLSLFYNEGILNS